MDDFIYEDIAVNSDNRNMSLGIFMKKSIYESDRIEIYESSAFGKCLYLDGALQLSEYDEKIYHESLAVISVLACKNPENILIIGGGDGCTLREILKFSQVKKITLCEINPNIINISKKYLPFSDLQNSLEDDRVNIVYKDGNEFLNKSNPNIKYDVIIVDCPDLTEESKSLFSRDFFDNVLEHSTKNLIFSIQVGNAFIKPEFIKNIGYELKRIYKTIKYFYAPIPSFPSGGIGFYFASLEKTQFQVPMAAPNSSEYDYLNSETLAAGLCMKPKYLTENKRMDIFREINKNEFNWIDKFGLQEFYDGMRPFIDLDGEIRSLDKQFTLMSFQYQFSHNSKILISMTMFTLENAHLIYKNIDRLLESKNIIRPCNIIYGMKWYTSGNFDILTIKKEDEIKKIFPLFLKQIPELHFDNIIVSYHYIGNMYSHTSLIFADLNKEYIINSTFLRENQRVRNNGIMVKETLLAHDINHIEQLESLGLQFDSIRRNKDGIEVSFEV